MKIKFPFFLLFLIASAPAMGQQKHKKSFSSFKVIGYYFLNAALRDTVHADSNYLFLNKITHLNIAFLNPDTTGNFNLELAIDTLIKKAHDKKVKVLASIGGGGSHEYYHRLLDDENRKTFIKNLVYLVNRYHLDGIDVDLEGSDIDPNYEKFVSELAAALHRMNKIITAAIATAYKDQLPDKALKHFDFINIMSYDQTGPWRPENPGDHSPYAMAVEDLNYWNNERSIPKQKLVLGLPFYGYGFGPVDSPVVSMDYQHIVSFYPNSQLSDTLNLPGNVVMYFNNIAMIKKKTKLAIENAGGVMIWQLLGDAKGEYSLLNAIQEVIDSQPGNKVQSRNERK
jgi:GH18 family chitinase